MNHEPGLMEMHIHIIQIKMNTQGIDMQKWTLAYMYDTHVFGLHIICSFRVHMICIPTTLTLPIA